MSTGVVSNTGRVLDACKEAGRTALIGYLPVGYPTVEQSVAGARTLVQCGADIIELGLPYSDPVMDGPLIAQAAAQALAGGTHITDTLRAVEQVAATGAAVVVMTYYNPVFHYGVAAFARDLAAAGGAGLITPDLIVDEAQEWIEASDQYGLDRIFLVAPSSPAARLQLTAAATRGFVYAASVMGVTGERTQLGSSAASLVQRTRDAGARHVCVGVGVSTPQQAAEVASFADGVIVGSAFVRALGSGQTQAEGLAALEQVALGLSSAVKE